MLRIDERQRRLVVSMGGRGLLAIGLAIASFGALFVVLILTASELIGQWTDYLPQAMFLAVPLLVMVAIILGSDKRPRTLEVDRQSVRLLGFVGWVTIPARELEELQVSTTPACLLARADRAQFRCGYGLSQPELAYLRQTVLRALRGH